MYRIIIVDTMKYNITRYNKILYYITSYYIMFAQCITNGSTMHPKWLQNGAQNEPKMGPKWSPKRAPKWSPFGKPFLSPISAVSSLKMSNPSPRTESASEWRVDQVSFTSAGSMMRFAYFAYKRKARQMNACAFLSVRFYYYSSLFIISYRIYHHLSQNYH